MTDTIPLAVKGGTLQFEIFAIANCNWNPVPGIYGYFASGCQTPLKYIGKAKDFRDRHRDHHIHERALRLGCSHFIAAVVQDEDDRARWEQEIYDEYLPELNTVRPSGPVLGAGTRMIFGLAPIAPNP